MFELICHKKFFLFLFYMHLNQNLFNGTVFMLQTQIETIENDLNAQ